MTAVKATADTDLFERIRVRDSSALEFLYQRHFQRLSRFVTQITRDPDESLEVVNDVFLVVWSSIDSFKGESSPSSWMMGIAYKKALRSISKKKNWLEYTDNLEVHEQPETDKKSDNQDKLKELMALLRPNERAVMELTYYFGYSYDEISEILDCPRDTIKNRLYQARKRLKASAIGNSNQGNSNLGNSNIGGGSKP